MMSKKQFACMLALHITYLLVGASIFYHIESPLEVAQRAEDKLERIEIQNLLYENYIPDDPDKQESILRKLSDYCGKPVYNYTTEDKEAPYKWDFYHSFFFSYTVVSTIGYGNLAPTTHLSRILMIFYGLFGIPINGILLANLGEYFGHQLISVYRKYKRKNNKRADNLNYFFSNLGMLGQIFLYLVPGFLFFIFLPACIFVVFEGWDYVASVYYAFVTLTTIGFGDLVAGTINNGFKDGYFFTYQIFLIVWITFGLGYIVMLLGFITSGMRSEGVHRLEQKLATQLKSTQNRILQGFSKDLNVLRKIINEANLVKLKPIYVEPAPFLYRSQSCPDFTFDVEPRGPIVRRKRANSENIHMMAKDILRIQSDTNLLGIDKEKTFTASAIVKPAELLARVVNVLGGLEQQQQQHHPEKGIHMFDDDQILSSEKPPVFSIGSDIITNSPKRMRASSVSVPIQRKDSMSKLDHELTWTIGDSAENFRKEANIRSGKLSLPATAAPHFETDENSQPKSILHKLFLRKTSSTESPPESIKHNVSRVTIDPHVTDNVKEKPKMRRGSIFPKFHFDDEDEDVAAVRAYQQKTKRHSIFPTFDFDEEEDDNAARYKETTRRGRHSIFPTFNFDDDDDDEVDEDEVRKYQNRTNRGRMSLFPTFGKKRHDSNEKKDDDDDDTVDEEEVQKYQNRTNKGRMSLFPTFGKRKNDSDEKKDDDVIDEDEVRSYRNRTNKGRMSLFPTFGKKRNDSDEKKDDDEPIDEDEVRSYQNRTNKGRLSLFPTFGKKRNDSDENKDDEDDTVDEEEVRKYQNRTNKGRLSLFPSFGKSKKHDDEVPMPESSDDLENYKSKTSRGRGSLFPTFGKERKNSSPKGSMSDLEASIRQYQNQSKKGRNGSSSGESRGGRRRGSLFDADLNIESLPQTEQVEVLEHTSVADLLRALAVLETVQGSDNSSEPRGLLDLIAQPTGGPNRRRGSIRPELILPSIPQRADTDSGSGPRRRRLSAKSTAPQFTPTLATVVAGAELQLTAAAARENRMSMLAQAPPPYTETANEDGPAPPRVRRYSPAPIENMRSTTAPVPRMFSRIRKESVASVEEEDSRRGSLTDVVIDNNKDKT